jgi:hypothetical protein
MQGAFPTPDFTPVTDWYDNRVEFTGADRQTLIARKA